MTVMDVTSIYGENLRGLTHTHLARFNNAWVGLSRFGLTVSDAMDALCVLVCPLI